MDRQPKRVIFNSLAEDRTILYVGKITKKMDYAGQNFYCTFHHYPARIPFDSNKKLAYTDLEINFLPFLHPGITFKKNKTKGKIFSIEGITISDIAYLDNPNKHRHKPLKDIIEKDAFDFTLPNSETFKNLPCVYFENKDYSLIFPCSEIARYNFLFDGKIAQMIFSGEIFSNKSYVILKNDPDIPQLLLHSSFCARGRNLVARMAFDVEFQKAINLISSTLNNGFINANSPNSQSAWITTNFPHKEKIKVGFRAVLCGLNKRKKPLYYVTQILSISGEKPTWINYEYLPFPDTRSSLNKNMKETLNVKRLKSIYDTKGNLQSQITHNTPHNIDKIPFSFYNDDFGGQSLEVKYGITIPKDDQEKAYKVITILKYIDSKGISFGNESSLVAENHGPASLFNLMSSSETNKMISMINFLRKQGTNASFLSKRGTILNDDHLGKLIINEDGGYYFIIKCLISSNFFYVIESSNLYHHEHYTFIINHKIPNIEIGEDKLKRVVDVLKESNFNWRGRRELIMEKLNLINCYIKANNHQTFYKIDGLKIIDKAKVTEYNYMKIYKYMIETASN